MMDFEHITSYLDKFDLKSSLNIFSPVVPLYTDLMSMWDAFNQYANSRHLGICQTPLGCHSV